MGTSLDPFARVTLYAPHGVPSIHDGDTLYNAAPDGAVQVPAAKVSEFLAMGCSRQPQQAPAVVNHIEPDAQP